MQYIFSFENFIFVDVLAVKVNGSDIKPGICLITPWCFNIQTNKGFKNFCILSSNNTYSVYNEVMYFQYVYNSVFPLIWKIGLDRATYIQKIKPEVARGGHIGVTTCQVASIDRHMLNDKHQRNLALTFNVYMSGAYNCEILNGNRPLRGFLTLDAWGFLTLRSKALWLFSFHEGTVHLFVVFFASRSHYIFIFFTWKWHTVLNDMV